MSHCSFYFMHVALGIEYQDNCVDVCENTCAHMCVCACVCRYRKKKTASLASVHSL